LCRRRTRRGTTDSHYGVTDATAPPARRHFQHVACSSAVLVRRPDGAGEPAGIDRYVQEIVAEQAALRRVATLVARGVFLTERLEQLREGGR
jgi:hypothetical protein